MKIIVLIPAILFFCFGCKTDAEENLRQILKEYRPKTQVFTVNSDSVIEIKGERGTILNIEPNVFEHLDGRKVTGAIDIRLVELTTTEDLLRANAQTVSGEKWLTSGGAYSIKAFSNNEELQLIDGKNIDAKFPKITSEEMQLFDGVRNSKETMNWIVSNQILENRKYPVLIEEDSSFMSYNQEWKIDIPIDTIVFRNLKERYSVDEVKNKYPEIDSLIVKNDTLFSYIFSARELFSEMLADSLLTATEVGELVRRKKVTRADIFIWELYNAIPINKLGWINVDRFYPEVKNRIPFEILPDIDLDYTQYFAADNTNNTLVNLHENEKGILSFNAPEGERFTIIAFGINGEQTYGYKKSILIEKTTKHKMKFRKIDNEKMEAYFNLD